MSECVVRMEMPKNCEACPMCGTASGGNGMYKLWCICGNIPASAQRRPKDCPIICALPENHGRLVDAEEMYKKSEAFCNQCRQGEHDCEKCNYIVAQWYMYKSPTIVPADTEERSET